MCGKPGHIACNCHSQRRSESGRQKTGRPGHSGQTRAHQVRAEEKDGREQHSSRDNPSDYLYSSEDSSEEVEVK